ncbi:MAG: carbon storage regulator [Gemmatales bacterium]|nr:carbon storage regulator [Gemmatales bacterium]
MLVVTRKVGEQIIVGDKVIVTVLEVRGRQAKIGIQAPDSVAIVRAELLTREPRLPTAADGETCAKPAECASPRLELAGV